MKVKNYFFNYFFNKFDFLIRFFYSQLGFLSRFFNKLFFWKLYASDFHALDENFEEMKRKLAERGFSLKDKKVLELGPGNSYINAFNFLAAGAEKVILVDKFSRQIKTKKQQEFFNNELDFIDKKSAKFKKEILKDGKIDKDKLSYIRGNLIEIDNLEKVDLICSMSVFEHINKKEVEKVIEKMAVLLSPGGLVYHTIDLRDHYNFSAPFLFYKYSDRTWDKFLTKKGLSYTNRLKRSDLIGLFLKYNFKIIWEETFRENLPNKIVSYFRSKSPEDLKVSEMKILLRKEYEEKY